MTTDNPFGPGGPLNDLIRRQREQQDLIKRALGPGYDLQQRIKAMESPLARFSELQRSGVVAQAAAARHSENIAALQRLATPAWMLALQETGRRISQDELGILKTQRLIAGSIDRDVLKLAQTIAANRSTVVSLLEAIGRTDNLRTLGDRFGPQLAGIRISAERARILDMSILRASADEDGETSVVVAAGQVLEAHRLIEAIGTAESPEQSADYLAALLAILAAMFARFGENTMNEVRNIGAVKLFEIVAVVLAYIQFATPPEMPAEQKRIVTELKVEVETLNQKLESMQAANHAADQAQLEGLPRAELKRTTAIRRAPQGKAPVLMRGAAGTLLAIKESKGQWRRVAYHDPLTDQLSEGWVFAPAVRLLDAPAP